MAKTHKVRKGPEESATKFSVGTKKKGNDGNMWKIVKNKKGTKRWQKEKNGEVRKTQKNKVNIKGKTYFTHDNGGRPFMVVVNGNNVDIYTYSKDFSFDRKLEKKDYNVLVKSYKNVKKIFIGKSIKGDDMYASFPNNPAGAAKAGLGNSILLNLSGNKYVFIGEFVYEFDTPDHIEEFYSMIGNSDVPYPVAVGEKNVYFLIQKGNYGYLSRDHFEDFPKIYSWGLDSYARLWGQGSFQPDIPMPPAMERAQKENRAAPKAMRMKYYKLRDAAQKKASLEKFVKKLKIKIIHKRPGWD